MKNETIAIIGYGVQGPAQALNFRDNGFNVIVGQRKGSKTWNKAVEHGWVPGETLFEIEEAAKKGTDHSIPSFRCRSDRTLANDQAIYHTR